MSDEERLNQAIEAILHDRSPRSALSSLDADEQRMVRMAQLMRGTQAPPLSHELTERLRDRLLSGRRVSRRAAFTAGLGALAAGILAGIGLDRVHQEPTYPPLAIENGKWYAVATRDDLATGAVRPFTAGAVQGFLLNDGGSVRALSRVCTHMGCVLRFNRTDQAFLCPCHGAEFDLHGHVLSGPGGYSIPLAPLPTIKVRVRGESIEVQGA
jgi:cytochrome b6-f complex iron-sulfur subunit